MDTNLKLEVVPEDVLSPDLLAEIHNQSTLCSTQRLLAEVQDTSDVG